MPTASTFRIALGVVTALLLIALAALITHVIQPATSHPFVVAPVLTGTSALLVGAHVDGVVVYLINNSGGQVEMSARSPQHAVLVGLTDPHVVCQCRGVS